MTITKKQAKLTALFRKQASHLHDDCQELQNEVNELQKKVNEKIAELLQIQQNKYKCKPPASKYKLGLFLRPKEMLLERSIAAIVRKKELMSMSSGVEVTSYAADDHCNILFHIQSDFVNNKTLNYEIKHNLHIAMRSGIPEVTKCSFPLGFNFEKVTEEYNNIMTPACLCSIRKALVAYYDRLKQIEELEKLLNFEAQVFKKLDGSHVKITFYIKYDLEDEEVMLKVILILDYRMYDIRPKQYSFNENDLPEDLPQPLRQQCKVFTKEPLHKAFEKAFMDGSTSIQMMQQLQNDSVVDRACTTLKQQLEEYNQQPKEREQQLKEYSLQEKGRAHHSKEYSLQAKERRQQWNEYSLQEKGRAHHSKEYSLQGKGRAHHSKEYSLQTKERGQQLKEYSLHDRGRYQSKENNLQPKRFKLLPKNFGMEQNEFVLRPIEKTRALGNKRFRPNKHQYDDDTFLPEDCSDLSDDDDDSD